VGGLILLLGDDRFDPAFAQVGTVLAGRVRLIARDCVGPGAGPADRAGNADLVQDGDELRTVSGLPRSDLELEGQALRHTGQVRLGGQSAVGTSQVSSGESGPAAAPHASSFFPLRVQLPVLFLAGAPFSAAAFSNASRISGSTIIPAAS
jgi:hypothetical protein